MDLVQYSFAYNENNSIIDIRNISNEYRLSHRFHCVSCGEEMVAKLGEKKKHHFAHKSINLSCSSETYLHKLCKLFLKENFEHSSSFEIEFIQQYKCTKNNTCPLYIKNECYKDEFTKIDLKKYFDTCEEEKKIGEYQPDLLLTNSLGKCKDKIFIEIFVTHQSTQEKIDSGIKIIEIQIKSEEDIFNLINGNIKENEGIKFYGFKRNGGTTNLARRLLLRFFLYESNSTYVTNIEDMPYCNEGKIDHKSILELNINNNHNIDNTYLQGIITAKNMGFKIKNCKLCKYQRKGLDSPIFCCLSKKFGTPREPKQSEANHCKYYSEDKSNIDRIKKEISNITIYEVK